MTQNTYLTQNEASEFLRLSARTLERWRVEGNGPRFHRFGKRVVYSKTALESWADERCFTSTSASPIT